MSQKARSIHHVAPRAGQKKSSKLIRENMAKVAGSKNGGGSGAERGIDTCRANEAGGRHVKRAPPMADIISADINLWRLK